MASTADSWTPEAAREVQDRNGPTQGAFRLALADALPGITAATLTAAIDRDEAAQKRTRLRPDPAGWYSLTIPGEPVAKGRVRARMVTPKGKAPFVTLYTPKETEDAELRIKAAWQAAGGPFLGGRLELELRFFQTPQKNRAPRHEDADNLGKLVMDALNTVAYPDDRNITHADLWKLEDEHNPRTVIRIRVMPI